MRVRVRDRLQGISWITLAAGMVLLTVTIGLELRSRGNARWVAHSRAVRATVDAAMANARDAVEPPAGLNDTVRIRSTPALGRLRADVARLSVLTADNPRQQRAARGLAARVARLPEESYLEEEGTAAPLRRQLEGFAAEELRLESARLSRAERERWLATWVVVAGIALMSLLSVIVDRRLLRQTRAAEMQAEQLEQQAVELEITLDEVKRAEEARDAARALLGAAMMSAPIGIAFLDEGGNVSRANASFLRLTGLADPMLGDPVPLPPALRVAARGTDGEDGRRAGRPVVLTVGGEHEERHFVLTAFPVHGASDAATGIMMIETTDRVRVEQQLRQVQKMEAVGQLAGGVAHDFNNLLAAISGYGGLVRDELNAGEPGSLDVAQLVADLDQVLAASERGSALTRQLMAFSRSQVVRPEPVSVGEVATAIAPMLRRLLGTSVTLDVQVEDDEPQVVCDRGQLDQVLLNLAVNARDAMPSGGELCIRVAQLSLYPEEAAMHPLLNEGRHVEITIADSGVGMDEGVQQRIFEPFFTTKPAGKGTGMGLSIVYGIVRQLNGEISVMSEPGVGTTFRILFPVAGPEVIPEWTEAPPSPSRRRAPAHATVVVADDEAPVRSVIARMLTGEGYTVREAASGGDALSFLEQEARSGARVELLITDVAMPTMAGPELAQRAVALMPGLQVLFISGYPNRYLADNPALAQEHTVMAKPFGVEELLTRVAAVLRPSVTSRPSTPPTVPRQSSRP